MLRLIMSAFFVILMSFSIQAAELRQWTGSNGKVIEAEFLGLDGDIVKLRLKTGKEVNVLLSKFSEADQKYAVKRGTLDDPFDDNGFDNPRNGISLQSPYEHDVLRVTLQIDVAGNGTVRLEKASTPPVDTFGGKTLKVAMLPKTRVQENGGVTKLTFAFPESGILDIFDRWNNHVYIDRDRKLLVFGDDVNNKRTGLSWPDNWGYAIDFPITVLYEVESFSEAPFNMEWFFNRDKELRSILSFRIFSSGNGIDGKFDIDFKAGKPRKKEIQGDWAMASVLERKGIDIKEPFEVKFKTPIPENKAFRFSIGRNMTLNAKEEMKSGEIGIKRLEITGRFNMPAGIHVRPEGKKRLVNGITMLSKNIGIDVGSEIVKINDVEVEKAGEWFAQKFMWKNCASGENFTVEFQKDGKTKVVKLVEVVDE